MSRVKHGNDPTSRAFGSSREGSTRLGKRKKNGSTDVDSKRWVWPRSLRTRSDRGPEKDTIEQVEAGENLGVKKKSAGGRMLRGCIGCVKGLRRGAEKDGKASPCVG